MNSKFLTMGLLLTCSLFFSNNVNTQTPELKRANGYCIDPSYCPDIADVFDAIHNNKDRFEKGKFEKTSEWLARQPEVLKEILISKSSTADSVMTFLYEPRTGLAKTFDASYDADKEVWYFPLELFYQDARPCIPMTSQKNGRSYCLFVDPAIENVAGIAVSMPRDVAKLNNDKIRIALVGKIRQPYILSSIEKNSGLFVEISKIVCLNPQNGKEWSVDVKRGEGSTLPSVVNQRPIPTTRRLRPISTYEATYVAKQTMLSLANCLKKRDFSALYLEMSQFAKDSRTPESLKSTMSVFLEDRGKYISIFKAIMKRELKIIVKPSSEVGRVVVSGSYPLKNEGIISNSGKSPEVIFEFEYEQVGDALKLEQFKVYTASY